MTNVLNWPGGLTAATVLALAGWLLVRATRDHRETLRFQQGLFLAAFGVRFVSSLLIYGGGLVRILQDEDSMGWVGGVMLMQRTLESGFAELREAGVIGTLIKTDNVGYQYLLAMFFTLTRLVGRLPAMAFTAFISAFGVVFVYRTVRLLATERAARWVAGAVTVLPLMVIWSSQTLKEPVVISIEAAALYACVRISLGRFSTRHVLLALAATLVVIPFRFYIAYPLGAALVYAIWRRPRADMRGIAWRTLTATFVAALLGLLTIQVQRKESPGLQRVQQFRQNVAPGGSAVVPRTLAPVAVAPLPTKPSSNPPTKPDVSVVRVIPAPAASAAAPQSRAVFDAREPAQIPLVVLFGSLHMLLAPFPWQFTGGSLRFLLTAPDMILWWVIFFWFVAPGAWRALRTRMADVAPLVIFLVLIGGLYSLMFANVGIAYRQRAQLAPVLLILAAAGRAPKREEA